MPNPTITPGDAMPEEVAHTLAQLRNPPYLVNDGQHSAEWCRSDREAAADLIERLVRQRDEAFAALKKLIFAARTSGGVAGRDAYLCSACEVGEKVIADAPPDRITHWMNGFAEMAQRAEKAEAELARADAVIACPNVYPEFEAHRREACERYAKRHPQDLRPCTDSGARQAAKPTEGNDA